MVMNMGGQAVVPVSALDGNETHVRIFFDTANDAIILTVVPDTAVNGVPEARQL